MKNFYSVVFLIILFSISSFYPQTTGIKKYHPLSGKIGISLEGGPTYTRSDFINDDFSYFVRLHAEYFFPTTQPGIWGIRAQGGGGYLQGSGGATSSRPLLLNFKTLTGFLGGGGEYMLAVSDVIMPYVYGGAFYLYFDPKDNDGNRLLRNEQKDYSRHLWMLNGELGIRFLISNGASLNFGTNINYVQSDNLDDVIAGSDNDVFFTAFAGVSIYFGGTPDSDEDGVNDDNDLCPKTPRGIIVDQFGCPVDTDNDGVPDYVDKCSNTPVSIPVNIDGCPVDSDGDGVPDYLDLCKDTPDAVPVDKRGCPFDEDGDGVPDYRDQCKETQIGTEVNRWGCPSEELEKKLPEITTLILDGDVNFEIGKSTLLPAARTELDKLVNVMKSQSETLWRIEGHTDNTGSYSLNQRLSLERATSVANYLIQNGIDRKRLEIDGMGPDFPIADNSTVTGRAMNRRVTIQLTTSIKNNSDLNLPKKRIEEKIPMGIYYSAIEQNVGNMIFTDGNLYCVQVASFRTRTLAENELERLQEIGQKAFIIEVNLPELDGTWYRVRIGYFNSLEEARQVREKFLQR
jgi:OOP family OmpA-OmpF porin